MVDSGSPLQNLSRCVFCLIPGYFVIAKNINHFSVSRYSISKHIVFDLSSSCVLTQLYFRSKAK